MLSLNDEALARLAEPRLEGNVRWGMPYEFASSILPEILGRFAEVYPDVALEVACHLSRELRARYQAGEFDMVFVAHAAEEGGDRAPGWQEPVVWVAGPRQDAEMRSPIPLVVAPEGCLYRARMIRALDTQCVPWRIVYTSPTLGGIRAGVMAGLGITALASSTVPDGLRILQSSPRLPTLPMLGIELLYDAKHIGGALIRLVEFMSERLTPGQTRSGGQHEMA
jgi:DNA-binding transcriptional LysR family regulator